MPLAIQCRNVFPACAYSAEADAAASGSGLATTVQTYLRHCDQEHANQHRGWATGSLADAFIFT